MQLCNSIPHYLSSSYRFSLTVLLPYLLLFDVIIFRIRTCTFFRRLLIFKKTWRKHVLISIIMCPRPLWYSMHLLEIIKKNCYNWKPGHNVRDQPMEGIFHFLIHFRVSCNYTVVYLYDAIIQLKYIHFFSSCYFIFGST